MDKPDAAEVERELKTLLTALPRENPAQQRLARELDEHLKAGSFDAYRTALIDFVKEQSAVPELGWGDLIADLVRQWGRQAGKPYRRQETRGARTRSRWRIEERRRAVLAPAGPRQVVVDQRR